jgi:ATP-dependent Lon protease
MRDELSYAALVDACLDVPPKADKRDMTAIKRLCTAFVKLLYPNALHKEDIVPDEFIKYCLNPAKEMRAIIKRQLCIVDPKEFDVPGKNTIPDVQYKEG